jgi:hypothetical protein
VGDEEERHAELLLEVLQQLQDLGLDDHVERAGGLVGQRHRDHHPLALAAGELVGIGAEPVLGLRQLYPLQQFQRAGLRPRPPHRLVDEQHLAHLLLDGVQRVERGHRLLEDHGDPVAADPAERALGGAHQLLTLEQDGPRRMVGEWIRQELHDRERRQMWPMSLLGVLPARVRELS